MQNSHASNYFWAFAGTIVIQNFGRSTREKCFRVAWSDYIFFLRFATADLPTFPEVASPFVTLAAATSAVGGISKSWNMRSTSHVSFQIQRFFQCKELPNDADYEHLQRRNYPILQSLKFRIISNPPTFSGFDFLVVF